MEEVILNISPSSVKKFRRCKRQYYYSMVEGLETRRPSLPIKRGNWVHELMSYHYMGRDWKIAHKALTKKFNAMLREEREYYGEDLPDECKRMMESYLYTWEEYEADWEILHVEENFTVEAGDGNTFSFKPDLIVYDKALKQTVCWDHKTTKTIPSAEFRLRDLQSALYPWGARIAGIPVDTFGFNYIRTKAPTLPHINKDGSISKARIDTDYLTMLRFLKEYYKDEWPNIPKDRKTQLRTLKQTNTYFKRTKMVKTGPVEKRILEELEVTTDEMIAWYEFHQEDEGDPWVRTMEKACEWDCDFEELCMVELMGGNGDFIRKTKFQPSKYLEGRKLGRQ